MQQQRNSPPPLSHCAASFCTVNSKAPGGHRGSNSRLPPPTPALSPLHQVDEFKDLPDQCMVARLQYTVIFYAAVERTLLNVCPPPLRCGLRDHNSSSSSSSSSILCHGTLYQPQHGRSIFRAYVMPGATGTLRAWLSRMSEQMQRHVSIEYIAQPL
jgi:hypothetical protein